MEKSGELLLISNNQQYYLRLFAVVMTVIINAQWYRLHGKGDLNRNLYLLVIPFLIFGLYFDYLREYSHIILFLILLLFIYIVFV